MNHDENLKIRVAVIEQRMKSFEERFAEYAEERRGQIEEMMKRLTIIDKKIWIAMGVFVGVGLIANAPQLFELLRHLK
jgi:hypothetical protein